MGSECAGRGLDRLPKLYWSNTEKNQWGLMEYSASTVAQSPLSCLTSHFAVFSCLSR